VDEELAEVFLADLQPTPEQIHNAIRRATLALKFVPVFCGSAYKNKGVQLLLNGVVDYLPNPTEKVNIAMDRNDGEKEVALTTDPKAPLVALAFKLEESRFGQLTYMRLYQGTMRRGDYFYNVDKKEKIKVCGPSANPLRSPIVRHACGCADSSTCAYALQQYGGY
jgi:elongation factor G